MPGITDGKNKNIDGVKLDIMLYRFTIPKITSASPFFKQPLLTAADFFAHESVNYLYSFLHAIFPF